MKLQDASNCSFRWAAASQWRRAAVAWSVLCSSWNGFCRFQLGPLIRLHQFLLIWDPARQPANAESPGRTARGIHHYPSRPGTVVVLRRGLSQRTHPRHADSCEFVGLMATAQLCSVRAHVDI